MYTKEAILSFSNEIGSVLNDLSQKVELAFEAESAGGCKYALGKYLYLIRYAHAYGIVSDDELDHRRQDWVQYMTRLSEVSPNVAFFAAYDAFQICARNENGLVPCHHLIANDACNHIIHNARAALYAHERYAGFFQMEQAGIYIIPLMNVLTVLAPHQDSSDLQNTFFEALTKFEDMLFDAAIHPLRRYEIISILKKEAEKKDPSNPLSIRMNEILTEAKYLPDGRGLILHDLETQADELGAESKHFYGKQIVNIQSAFAVRAGVSGLYAQTYARIDSALKNNNFDDAESGLYELFKKLLEKDSDIKPSEGHISTLSYWLETASHLQSISGVKGFHLAEQCIKAVEEQNGCSEHIQASVYGFALPAILDMEIHDSQFEHRAVELYKIIMKRSSEFVKSKNTDDIFECAAIGFRQFLGTISPVARYREMLEFENWLASRDVESPYLQDFVDDLMNARELYGNDWGIALEEDESASVHNFSPNQP